MNSPLIQVSLMAVAGLGTRNWHRDRINWHRGVLLSQLFLSDIIFSKNRGKFIWRFSRFGSLNSL